MNSSTANINRLEFAVTYACTGKCAHCSEADKAPQYGVLDAEAAVRAVRELADCRNLESVMTFGGEPLIFPKIVCAIHRAATELGIKKRQIITNGFFSRNIDEISATAEMIAKSGVNDILLSVDAFHQETIPVGPVVQFALQIMRRGVKIRLSPAWLVSREDKNPFNERTRSLLAQFGEYGIEQAEGNVIFRQGNARKYLAEYFDGDAGCGSPYDEDPHDIRSICVLPDGSVLGGNICKESIASIVEEYIPAGE